jgi:hypothetical protein
MIRTSAIPQIHGIASIILYMSQAKSAQYKYIPEPLKGFSCSTQPRLPLSLVPTAFWITGHSIPFPVFIAVLKFQV